MASGEEEQSMDIDCPAISEHRDTVGSKAETNTSEGSLKGASERPRGRKRARVGVDEEPVEVEKRGCEEGMSWYMCLMLGVDQSNTKPQVVKKLYPSNSQNQ